MYENFTDAENTGAPLVPQVEEPSPVTDGGNRAKAEHEEIVLSHRLRE